MSVYCVYVFIYVLLLYYSVCVMIDGLIITEVSEELVVFVRHTVSGLLYPLCCFVCGGCYGDRQCVSVLAQSHVHNVCC